MKTLGCFLLLALVVLLGLPVSAMAGDITLFGGYQHPGKLTLSAAGSSTPGLTNPADIGLFGVRYKHSGFVGVEHTLAYAPNFIDSQSKAFIYNSDVIIAAPAPVVQPYITAGIGSVIVKGTGLSDIGAKFAINYGGGVKKRLVGPVNARIDVRGYSITGIQSQTLHVLETSFGLVFSN